MSNVIYVDILLMINLLVNFLMLSAAGLLVKTPTRSWRILLSAAIGAVYSLIIFLPDMNLFFSIALRVICFAAMLFTAFSIRSVKDFLRAGGGFLMANFAFAGITLAIWLIFKPDGLTYKNGAVYFDISAVTPVDLRRLLCCYTTHLLFYAPKRARQPHGNSQNRLSRKRSRMRRSHRYWQLTERAVFLISCDSV